MANPLRDRQGGIEDLGITAAVTLEHDPADRLDHKIDDNERGLKDTVRVNPKGPWPNAQ